MDNSFLREVLGGETRVSLEEGIARTYGWIEERVTGARGRRKVEGR